MGASTAYHLALRGVKPLVIERSKIAAAASGKAGGFLAGGWGSGPTVKMHEVSFDMHERLAEELGVTSYRKIPTLQVSTRSKGVRTCGTQTIFVGVLSNIAPYSTANEARVPRILSANIRSRGFTQ